MSSAQTENEWWASRQLYFQEFHEEFLQRHVYACQPHILIKEVWTPDSNPPGATLPCKVSLPGFSKAQPGKEVGEEKGREQQH